MGVSSSPYSLLHNVQKRSGEHRVVTIQCQCSLGRTASHQLHANLAEPAAERHGKTGGRASGDRDICGAKKGEIFESKDHNEVKRGQQ